ncbi:hypothetical protein [Novipirellula sp.]|uniref:hypothetical protein n=1 Tax=Novipirellula sp. TaxID=2795430 RepID=UPI0035680FA0
MSVITLLQTSSPRGHQIPPESTPSSESGGRGNFPNRSNGQFGSGRCHQPTSKTSKTSPSSLGIRAKVASIGLRIEDDHRESYSDASFAYSVAISLRSRFAVTFGLLRQTTS